MCGILGLIKFDGQEINERDFRNFTNSLNHRGPDGSDIFLNKTKKIGLGHTRTITFDTSSNGVQPMSYLEGRYIVTFNGDIFNFLEIREELKLLGHKFITDTDTEVILAAYSEWGEDCQFKFNGDWAFAIWDDYKKKLFISRDRFGTKPLYYIYNKKYFIFASELKAFMSLAKDLRPDFDYGFLLWLGYNYGSLNTFLKDVFLLQAGSQINIDNNYFKIKKWWSTIKNLVDIPNNYNEQVERFKELFFESCKIRLRSDVPIAASLSGGIDSSSVCSTIEHIQKNFPNIQRYSEKDINVFICEFFGDQNSEKKFAQDVILNKKILPHYIDLNEQSLNPDILNKVQFDNEWVDPDSIPVSLMYKKMREMGVRISLDGAGPDETLGGYWEDPYFAMIDEVRFFNNTERFNDLMSIKNEINNKTDKSKYKFLLRKLIGPTNFSKLTTLFNTIKNGNIYNYDKYNLAKKTKNIYPEEDDIKKLNHFNTRMYKQFHYYNITYDLLKFDKLAMSHGVITRSPFLDHNLIRYIFSLPSSAKIGEGYTKKILRDSMKNLVPNSVLSRKDKRGFASPHNWYGKNINNYMLDSLNSSDFLNSNIFDGKKIKKDYEENSIYISSKIVLKYIQALNLVSSFKQLEKH